jgi:alkylmercury lyase
MSESIVMMFRMLAARDLELLAARLGEALPTLDTGEQEVAMTLVHLLAGGEPVPASRLAAAVGQPDALEEQLTRLSGLLFRDDRGRVIGFMGLSVIEMGHHRVHIDGRALSAWCAWDTLFLPELLGRTAGVTSRCPITGEEISLITVGLAGVADLHPAETVVSFMVPEEPIGDDVIRSFCHFVHFFASEQAGRQWTIARDGAFLLSVADAYQLGRLTNRAAFGAALGSNPICRGGVRA